MKLHITIVLVVGAIVISAEALAGEASFQSPNSQIDGQVKVLSDAQNRVLGKAVAFCADQHQPQGLSLDDALKAYVAAFSEGTKAGMIEILKSDKNYLTSTLAFRDTDFEMMDKQADSMLKSVQAAPATACKKLGAVLVSGTSATFKESTLRAYNEYKAKRAEYCSRIPKPKNCE